MKEKDFRMLDKADDLIGRAYQLIERLEDVENGRVRRKMEAILNRLQEAGRMISEILELEG